MFDTTIRLGTLAQRRTIRAVALWVAAIARPAAANIYRALLLLLVGLLGLCAGLMCLTGRYDVGSLVIGCVLLVGLGAANWTR
jgi:hypothetical protein